MALLSTPIAARRKIGVSLCQFRLSRFSAADDRPHAICPQSNRLPAHRRTSHCAFFLVVRAPSRRTIRAAHRRYGSRTLDARRNSADFARLGVGRASRQMKGLSTRRNASIATSRSSTSYWRAAMHTTATAAKTSSRNCAQNRWPVARSPATTAAGGIERTCAPASSRWCASKIRFPARWRSTTWCTAESSSRIPSSTI